MELQSGAKIAAQCMISKYDTLVHQLHMLIEYVSASVEV